MTIQKINQIVDLCKNKGVKHIYIFGSYANNEVTPLSDFDLAIFLNKKIKKQDYLTIKLRLMTELENILSLPKVDVIILNSAPTAIRYSAVTYSQVIYSDDDEKRFKLEHQILQEYEDFLPYIKKQYYLQRQAIMNNQFGQPLI